MKHISIREIAKDLRDKKYTSVELTKEYLKRIKEKDGEINAFVTVTEEEALKAAQDFDNKLAKGEDLPMLAGIPMSLKDLFNTKGIKTTSCSKALENFISPYDATVVKKLKEYGAVLVGKVNMDEFACGVSTEHSYFGVTKNPLDLERVSGGSSGGSAASVAADMCLYSLCTDTGGSIRQPAAFCGNYGLKTTYGRISRSGVNPMASSWDTVGHIANSVEDIAIVLEAIAGHDPKDSTTPDVPITDYVGALNQGVEGMKIGLPKEYFDEGVKEDVKNAVMKEIERLKALGAEIKEISLPMTKYAVAVYYISTPAELSANLERFDGIRYGHKAAESKDLVESYFNNRGESFGEEIQRRIMIGTYVLSAGYYDAYYKKAQKARTLTIQDFNKAFEEVDAIIAPSVPMRAFKIGELLNDPLAMYMIDALTIPANAAGIPSLACPIWKEGETLPYSMQIMAPQFKEDICLNIASALEE